MGYGALWIFPDGESKIEQGLCVANRFAQAQEKIRWS